MLFTRRMSFRRRVRGIATVLGMLIFIGVLFTCVIPLFLYVNRVNSLYDQTVVEMSNFDECREMERIDVYAYPLEIQSDQLNVYIKNRSPFSVEVVRVWVNDEFFNASLKIPAMMDGLIESISVTLPSEGVKAFKMKVTTSRGNVFPSLTNPLYYTADGGWSGSMAFTIQVVIETPMQGNVDFTVEVTGPNNFMYEGIVRKASQENSCFLMVGVPMEGLYNVTVSWGKNVVYEEVYVTPNEPYQWVYIYAEE